jgi:hypothetical protein
MDKAAVIAALEAHMVLEMVCRRLGDARDRLSDFPVLAQLLDDARQDVEMRHRELPSLAL